MKQRIKRFNEGMALVIMSYLKYDKNENFYKCRKNDLILSIAKVFLGGRNPIDFACEKLREEGIVITTEMDILR